MFSWQLVTTAFGRYYQLMPLLLLSWPAWLPWQPEATQIYVHQSALHFDDFSRVITYLRPQSSKWHQATTSITGNMCTGWTLLNQNTLDPEKGEHEWVGSSIQTCWLLCRLCLRFVEPRPILLGLLALLWCSLRIRRESGWECRQATLVPAKIKNIKEKGGKWLLQPQ